MPSNSQATQLSQPAEAIANLAMIYGLSFSIADCNEGVGVTTITSLGSSSSNTLSTIGLAHSEMSAVRRLADIAHKALGVGEYPF